MGFDVPDDLLGRVSYSRKRLVVEAEAFTLPVELAQETLIRFFFTKYSHWRYENEMRCLATLNERDPKTNLYFADFGDDLRLMSVFVGAQSAITRSQLNEALGDLAPFVEVFKARLAFKTFRVVRQQQETLWV